MKKLASLNNQTASWTSLVFDYTNHELINFDFALVVTSTSWTDETLNVDIMTSSDNLDWGTSTSFTEVTDVTTWEIKNLLTTWKLIRFDYTIAWTLPSFNFEIYVTEK